MKFLGILLLFAYLPTQKNTLLHYHTLHFSDKNLNILLRTSSENYEVYLHAVSHDVLVKETGLLISKDSLHVFLTEIQLAFEKYKEWTKVVQKNQVVDYAKDIPLETSTNAFFMSGGKFHYAEDLPLRYTFKAIPSKKGVKTQVLLHSTKFLSNENEFIHCKGFSIPLSSSGDFENLISALQPSKISSFLQTRTYDKLFKN
jgi:hypothetical protein